MDCVNKHNQFRKLTVSPNTERADFLWHQLCSWAHIKQKRRIIHAKKYVKNVHINNTHNSSKLYSNVQQWMSINNELCN